MKKSLIIGGILLALVLFGSLNGLHFKDTSAMPWEVKVIHSYDTDYGKAILFEDKTNKTFGVAKLERKFGFLYRYAGGSAGYMVEEGKPFEVTGMADNMDFIVGLKTAKNSNIKYIAIGNHMEEITPSDTYDLSLNDVKATIDHYHLKEVVDNYTLFVLDEYTEDTWTFRAFDEKGDLIADKLPGAEERYIDWE